MSTNRPELDDDDDDDFSELYKEYTGPGGSSAKVQEKTVPSKVPHANDDVEEEMDPNAVPTDFTSRDAKVWEAKSKATERNWKKRTEEEMICKLCGELGHFTQGCPTTLGANRKSQDFFQRVPARDRRVRRLFTEKVIEKIEKEVGCRIKMDEKFLFVHGKDGTILSKGVDAVHKIIQEEGDGKGSPGSHRARSRSPERISAGSKFTRSDSELSHLSPRNSSQSRQRLGRQDSSIGARLHEEFHRPSRNSPQAYVNDGARRHSSRSKSPARHPHSGKSYESYDADRHQLVSQSVGWNNEKRVSEVSTDREFEQLAGRLTLEEVEMEYESEALDLRRIRDQQEDEENYNHRKAIGELRENYTKKLAVLRGTHAKQWEELLHTDAQRQRQVVRQPWPTSGYGDYPQPGYSDYDHSPSANSHGSGPKYPMGSRCRYPEHMENFQHSRTRDTYNDFQSQKSGDYGRAYNRY